LSEIKAFAFGGMTARFMMLRKHINSMTISELKVLPFFAWECITLYTDMNTIDLVIRDQQGMDMLLKLLLVHMNSYDGQRDTATKIKKVLLDQEIERSRYLLDEKAKALIIEKINHKVMC
jgi:hypothetical protein